jgi:hypothetical protein
MIDNRRCHKDVAARDLVAPLFHLAKLADFSYRAAPKRQV